MKSWGYLLIIWLVNTGIEPAFAASGKAVDAELQSVRELVQQEAFRETRQVLEITKSPWERLYNWMKGIFNSHDLHVRTKNRLKKVDKKGPDQAIAGIDQDLVKAFSDQLTRRSKLLQKLRGGLSFDIDANALSGWFKPSPPRQRARTHDPVFYGLKLKSYQVKEVGSGHTTRYDLVPEWSVVPQRKSASLFSVRPGASAAGSRDSSFMDLLRFKSKLIPTQSVFKGPGALDFNLEIYQINNFYKLELPSVLQGESQPKKVRHHLYLPINHTWRLGQIMDGDYQALRSAAEWNLAQHQMLRIFWESRENRIGSEWILDDKQHSLVTLKSTFGQETVVGSPFGLFPHGDYRLTYQFEL